MQGKLLAFFPDFLKTGGHVGFTENKQILTPWAWKICSPKVALPEKTRGFRSADNS
jgi:ribosomal protein S11